MQVSLDAAIAVLREEFSVETADCPAILREAYRLRHQVYCLERGYEAASGDIETDDYDHRAHHIVVRHRASAQVVGTVRLVLPSPATSESNFPMQRVVDPHIVSCLPLHAMAEISRFAISKAQREASQASQGLLRLSLMRGVMILTNKHGLTHLCALIEPTLLRLLHATAIHFSPVGPPVEHHGMRQLVFCQVDELLGRLRRDQPPVWDFITDGGRLWSSSLHPRLTPA